MFTRHYFEGDLQRAETGVQAAALDVQRTRGVIAAELARTRAELDSAMDRARRHDEILLNEAQRATLAAEQAYRGGEIGVMGLLDARRNLYAGAHRRRASAQRACESSRRLTGSNLRAGLITEMALAEAGGFAGPGRRVYSCVSSLVMM